MPPRNDHLPHLNLGIALATIGILITTGTALYLVNPLASGIILIIANAILFLSAIIWQCTPPTKSTTTTIAIFANVLGFAAIYSMGGILHKETVVHDFPNALYFSIVTWTTLGYGDFTPTKNVQFFAALEAVLGYIFMGLYLAAISNTQSHFRERTNADISK